MRVVIVDSAQSWTVTTGCCIINILMVGIMKVFSLIIVEYRDILDASLSMLLFGASMMTSIGLAAPLSTYLSEKMTTRKLGLCAAILSTISLVILANAHGISEYLVSTLILGLSFSFIFIPTFSIPGRCHVRHQTLSQGIITSGGSLGTLVMPLILAQLIHIYSIRGFVLILAGLILNFAVGAVLMPTHIVSLADPCKPVLIMCQDENINTNNTKRYKKIGNLKIYGQLPSTNKTIIWPPREMYPSLIFFSFGMAFIMNGYMILSGLYGTFADSFNLEITNSAYILMGHSCLELVSRILIGFVVDIKICQGYLLYCASAIFLSMITVLTSLASNIILFYVFIFSNAIFGSVFVVLQVMMLADVVGITQLHISFSIYTFIQGILAIPSYYGIGKICDINESPNFGVFTAGVMIFLGAVLLLIERCIKKSRNV